jgi:MFS transporter, PPP family, 3-phenylpropionic acid transporter
LEGKQPRARFYRRRVATGVGSETLLFLAAARYFTAENYAARFLILDALGAIIRWLAMSADPGPALLIFLQAMHGLSFGATYFGSVLLLGGIARETHRARMQGWLASASALSLALATFAAGCSPANLAKRLTLRWPLLPRQASRSPSPRAL